MLDANGAKNVTEKGNESKFFQPALNQAYINGVKESVVSSLRTVFCG
jgi:hypothetical protein